MLNSFIDKLNPFRLRQDPASRAILQDEFIARGVGAKQDEGALAAAAGTSKSTSIECRVCSQQTEAPVVFLPCSHRVACANCASRMKKCLECRAPIDKKVLFEPRILDQLAFWTILTFYLFQFLAGLKY